MKPGRFVDLGVRDYAWTWALQQRLVARRQAGEIPDTVLFVEHPDVITLGRRASARANVLQAGEVPVIEIERGGDATYHGPGQLVGYPILRLEDEERDLHAYLRALEEALLLLCAELGIAARREPGWTGVWLGERKLASIGIAVRRWVTMHGFALNVSTDLSRFARINPCGLDAGVMTSLVAATGRALTVDAIKPRAAACLGAALHRELIAAGLQEVDDQVSARDSPLARG